MRVMVFADQLRTAFELARKPECGLMIHEKQAARVAANDERGRQARQTRARERIWAPTRQRPQRP
jgi:hypothetical protein